MPLPGFVFSSGNGSGRQSSRRAGPAGSRYRAPVVAGVVTMGNWDDDPDDDEPLYNPFEEN